MQVEFAAAPLCSGALPVGLRVGKAADARSILVLCDNLISEHNVVRHDPQRLAQFLLTILERHLTPPFSFSDVRRELMSSPHHGNEP